MKRSITKPSVAAVEAFAKGPKAKPSGKSGQVPDGDVRLTANIRTDLHTKLKVAAAERRTTVGQLLEQLIEKHL